MAELFSEELDCPSNLALNVVENKQLTDLNGEKQLWQVVSLQLVSGKRQLSTLPEEETMLCRTPSDEVAQLANELLELAEDKRTKVFFEPSEPSFELTFARSPRGGVRVEAWLDAGNGISGIYTWDASGIRFITTNDKLKDFAAQLQEWSSAGE